jgi:predicted TIM-barrel fold metal-dependent hydrolase
MFASNFPMDKLHADYGEIWSAFDQITADFSEAERRALFHDNAARLYRLQWRGTIATVASPS